MDKLAPRIYSDDYDVYDKYKKLKLSSIFKVGHIYHCETEEGLYLWVEIYSGKITLAMAETHLGMEDNIEIAASYSNGKPDLEAVIKYFEWVVNEDDIWDD